MSAPARIVKGDPNAAKLHCAFCYANEDEAVVLVRGDIVCICGRCAKLCAEIVTEFEEGGS